MTADNTYLKKLNTNQAIKSCIRYLPMVAVAAPALLLQACNNNDSPREGLPRTDMEQNGAAGGAGKRSMGPQPNTVVVNGQSFLLKV